MRAKVFLIADLLQTSGEGDKPGSMIALRDFSCCQDGAPAMLHPHPGPPSRGTFSEHTFVRLEGDVLSIQAIFEAQAVVCTR